MLRPGNPYRQHRDAEQYTFSIDSNKLTSSGYLVPAAEFNNLQEVLIITEVKEEGNAAGE